MSLRRPGFAPLVLWIILLALPVVSGAAPEPSDRPITAQDRASLIDAIAKQLEARYVIPEAVPRIVAVLRDKLGAGGYGEATATAFAQALTEDLRTGGRDLHFDVSYDPARERELSAAGAATRKRLPEIEANTARLEAMRRSNYGFRQVERLSGNVGYLDLRFFEDLRYSHDTAAGAMALLAGADAVIIDLRQNPGGYGNLSEFLVSYFFGERPVDLMASYDRETGVTKHGRSLRRLPGKRMPDAQVYLLTGPGTGSAAEAFAFTLQRKGRARTVGERTAGAAHGGGWVPLGQGFVIFMPTFRGFDPRTGEDWESVGVPPDIEAPADGALEAAHLEAVRRLADKATEPEWKRQLAWLVPLLELAASGPQPAADSLQNYAGAYDRATIEVDREGAHFIGASGVRRRLLALADHTFLIEDLSVPPENQARLRFVLDPQGKVTGLELLAPDGRVLPRPRLP